MNTKELKELIKSGESINLEFKAAKANLPSSFFETVCAFLNREGGKIILGVAQDGSIQGVQEDRVNSILEEIANNSNNKEKLTPPFILFPKVFDIEDKKIILVDVPRSSQVHITKGKIYDRSQDGDFEITDHTQKSNLYTNKSTEFSETKVYPYLELRHFKPELFKKVRNLLRDRDENHSLLDLTDEELLRALGLYREDLQTGEKGYTLASALLFGKDETIQSVLPHFKVDALVRRRDLDRYDDRLEVRTNLIEAYEQLMEFIKRHLPDPYYDENGIRVSLRTRIFREVIANILVHAEYTVHAFTRLIIYKDRVETENPSRPFRSGLITPENLVPKPKNPLLAKLFIQIGRVEELGSGVRRTNQYVPIYSNGRRPKFEDGDVFKTFIPLPDGEDEEVIEEVNGGVNQESGGVFGGVNGGINSELIALLQAIESGRATNTVRLTETLEIPKRTIERYIKELKSKEMIVFEGAPKTGKYTLTERGQDFLRQKEGES